VVIAAESSVPVVQALVRWDPAGAAARELADRGELRFPPAVRMASLTGRPDAVGELLSLLEAPDPHEVIGPVPLEDGLVRTLVRVPRDQGALLAARLHQASGARSARKSPDPVRVMMDPTELF
jgi:primosomal protein N' (replication factor Y) (superfamily II helicase)